MPEWDYYDDPYHGLDPRLFGVQPAPVVDPRRSPVPVMPQSRAAQEEQARAYAIQQYQQAGGGGETRYDYQAYENELGRLRSPVDWSTQFEPGETGPVGTPY